MDGIVLARSVFHHSFNYRSAVIFGKARLVDDPEEKISALKIEAEASEYLYLTHDLYNYIKNI